MKSGIVGLPNAGKSTLFNLLTQSDIALTGNYPFCTIEPNTAKVEYQDERLQKVSQAFKSMKIIYANLEFHDIAGLVEGASKGEGLGNKFCANISEVDLIIHVVRCFEGNITHVMNRVNPIADLELIIYELQLYDLERIENLKIKNKKNTEALKTLDIAEKHIKNLTICDDIEVKKFNFLSLKPFIVIGNGNDTKSLELYCNEKQYDFLELDVENLSLLSMEEDQNPYFQEIAKVIQLGYRKLDLITYFTAGEKEARAWRISKNTLAPIAAGKIHADFIKHFIRAELITYENFCNNKLNYIVVGKDYVVQDADILNFRIGK